MKQFSVEKSLGKMNKNRKDFKVKGTAGEEAVLAILQEYQNVRGGTIFHSYTYEYSKRRDGTNYPGNIKLEQGKFIEIPGNKGTQDEIDLVYVTPYRIFAIECKARTGKWKVYDHWASQSGKEVDKSPVAQCEKHARHLYYMLYEFLPDGRPEYIVPLTVFVDRATIEDSRAAEFRQYLPIAIINNFKVKLVGNDSPLKYELETEKIIEKLKRSGTNTGMY